MSESSAASSKYSASQLFYKHSDEEAKSLMKNLRSGVHSAPFKATPLERKAAFGMGASMTFLLGFSAGFLIAAIGLAASTNGPLPLNFVAKALFIPASFSTVAALALFALIWDTEEEFRDALSSDFCYQCYGEDRYIKLSFRRMGEMSVLQDCIEMKEKEKK